MNELFRGKPRLQRETCRKRMSAADVTLIQPPKRTVLIFLPAYMDISQHAFAARDWCTTVTRKTVERIELTNLCWCRKPNCSSLRVMTPACKEARAVSFLMQELAEHHSGQSEREV